MGKKEQPPIFVETEQEAIAIVAKCGDNLRRLEAKWRNNKNVVLVAVQQNGFSFEYASKALKDDAQIVYNAVKKEPRMLMEASKRWRENKSLREMAYKLNGSVFIIDPVAFAEFIYLDKLILGKYRTFVNEYGEYDNPSVVKEMKCDPFYKKLKHFYTGEDMSVAEIEELERWLLANRTKRLSHPNEYYKAKSLNL